MASPYDDKERETAVAPSQSAGAPSKPKGRDTSRLSPPPDNGSSLAGGVKAAANFVGRAFGGGDDQSGSDVQLASTTGGNNIYENTAAETPTFSNTQEGARLTAPPTAQNREAMEAMPELGAAKPPENAVGSLARAREQGLTQPPPTTVVGQDGGRGILSRDYAQTRSDRIRFGDNPELLAGLNEQRRELGAAQEEAGAERQFERGQTQMQQRFESQENQADRQTELQRTRLGLTPPPQYVTGSDGSLMRVEGTEAQPVQGPGGQPFQGASGDAGQRQEAYLDLVKSLTPEGGFATDADRQRVMESADAIFDTLYGGGEGQDLSDLPENELITDNVTGEQFYIINGEKVPAEMMPRR